MIFGFYWLKIHENWNKITHNWICFFYISDGQPSIKLDNTYRTIENKFLMQTIDTQTE